MKKAFLTLPLMFGAMCASAADVITLDLTKSTTPLEFNADNGAWTGTYDEDAESIESQCFQFVHAAMASYQTWWGFTASNSADNKRQENTILYQFSNMAAGGIVLNEDGTVKKDEFGAPVVSAQVPYLVAYYNSYMSRRPCDLTFKNGKSHELVGMYVNLNSYPYYCIEYGDSYARAFTNGDKFTLTVHGVKANDQEETLDIVLASYTNGDLTINRGWRYVDLSALGTVNELYFTMASTDTGDWGMNTPGYFCMDKLMVKPSDDSGVSNIAAAQADITYNRATKTVSVNGAGFACVYDALGNRVKSSESSSFSIEDLQPGVYIVRALNTSLKIVK